MNPKFHRIAATISAAICKSAKNCITFQKGDSSSPGCSAKSLNISGSWFMALMVLGFGAQAVPPTWSPTDRNQAIAVTADTATRNNVHGGGWVSVRSDLFASSGIHTVYFYVANLGPQMEVGIANAANVTYLGQDANSIGYRQNGGVQKGGAWVALSPQPPPFTTGDTLGMQIDFVALTVKFNKNGGAWSGATDITSLGTSIYIATSLGDVMPFSSVQILPTSDWGGPVVNLVCAGDSLTVGGGAIHGYCERLAGLIQANSGTVSWVKVGINGATWNYTIPAYYPYSMMQDALLRVDPERVSDIPSWLVGFAGTNGIAVYHRSAAQECADAKTWADGRVAAGWLASHVILNAMLPRTGVDEATFRTPYNACLRTTGYTVAPLDLDPNIGCAGCNLNPAMFLDGVHPTDAGAAIVAQIIQSVMH